MDFDLTDEQEATAEAATKLLADKSTPEALRALEERDDLRFDRDLWAAMADAGLLGIAVPEEHGGAGLGLLELCLVLQEVGRRTAAVPALGVARVRGRADRPLRLRGAAGGAPPRSGRRHASCPRPRWSSRWPTRWCRPRRPSPTATAGCSRARRPTCWPASIAELLLVPASTPDGIGVFLVPADAEGLTRTRQETTTGTPDALVTLEGVRVGRRRRARRDRRRRLGAALGRRERHRRVRAR